MLPLEVFTEKFRHVGRAITPDLSVLLDFGGKPQSVTPFLDKMPGHPEMGCLMLATGAVTADHLFDCLNFMLSIPPCLQSGEGDKIEGLRIVGLDEQSLAPVKCSAISSTNSCCISCP